MQTPFQTEWCLGFRARHWGKLWIAQAAILLIVGFAIASSLHGTPAAIAPETGSDSHAQHADGPSMWTCSMHPQIRSSNPGKCPICGMDLIPVAKTSGGMRTLTVSPASKALMKIQISAVERRYVSHEIPMVGKVAYDGTNQSCHDKSGVRTH